MKKILSIVFLCCIYVSTYAQPANDEPCGAIALTPIVATTLPTTCTPTTVLTWTGATNSTTSPFPNCGNWTTTKRDVWYKINIPDGVDSILINTLTGLGANPTTDAVMVMYSATACDGTFTQLACVDDVSGNPMPLIRTVIPNAGVYYIRIFDFYATNANGDMKICISIKYNIPTPDPAKNVGIGIAYPEKNLDVNGTAKIRTDLTIDNITKTKDIVVTNNVKIESGNPAIGKVLTSDAAGNATWQEKSSNGGVGFGSWGDCSMNNVSEYNPAVDDSAKLGNKFGQSVAIAGNFALVGTPYETVGSNIQQGSVTIYKFDGTNWVIFQKLIESTGTSQNFFGGRVAINGNYIVVGIQNQAVGGINSAGAVNIYKYNGISWVFMQKLTDSDPLVGESFGQSISIFDTYVAVGITGDNVGGIIGAGSVAIFKLNTNIWTFVQKINAQTVVANDAFGTSVSIFENTIIVGSILHDDGISPDVGQTSFFKFNGNNWVFMNKIDGAVAGARLGGTVSVSGNFALSSMTGINNSKGQAQIYKLNNNIWELMQTFSDPDGASNDIFGMPSISGDYVVLGSIYKTEGGITNRGVIFIYKRLGGRWNLLQKITDPQGASFDRFGGALDFDSQTKRFVIGASGYNSNTGKVIFGKLNL